MRVKHLVRFGAERFLHSLTSALVVRSAPLVKAWAQSATTDTNPNSGTLAQLSSCFPRLAQLDGQSRSMLELRKEKCE